MIKNRRHLSLCSRFGSLLSMQASGNVLCFAQFISECTSMATLICAHGTAILTNHGHSEFVPSKARSLFGLESHSMASGRISHMFSFLLSSVT